jgi:hypothetical protein
MCDTARSNEARIRTGRCNEAGVQAIRCDPGSLEAAFIIRDAKGRALAYVYFEDETVRQMSMKRLSRDEARRVAANIAKLPDLLRK